MTAVLGAIAPAAVAAGAEMWGTHMRNVSARQVAERQMDFQKEMSSTAYQRGVADMKSAGINPVLGHMHAAASSPGGAGYDPQAMGQNVASALNLARMRADIAFTRAQTKAVEAQAEKTEIGNVGAWVKSLPWQWMRTSAKEVSAGKWNFMAMKKNLDASVTSSAKDYVRGFKRPWKP